MVGNLGFPAGNGQEISSDIERLETPEGELHLRFFLTSGSEFALSATGIKEVMNQPPDRITSIPNASPLLLGTINLRGQVIWVADLGQFLGDAAVLNTQRPEIPIIAIEDQEIILGLAIDKIGEMQWLDIAQIQMPTNIPNHMAPFIRGEWVLNPESDRVPLRLLDQIAILRSARWAA
jgi:purine-binding chemotaxis protein CheW